MVIWTGRGWVLFAMVIGLGAVVQWLVEAQLHVAYQGWPLSLVFVVVGVFAAIVGPVWNGRARPAPHTLFFVPMQWWAPILVVLAIANAVWRTS